MKARTLFVLGAILLATITRIIPHPPNFAPITAMALFGAATLTDRRLALVTPLLALFLSDLAIQAMYQFGAMTSWGLYPYMWATYGATLAVIALGFALRKHHSPLRIAAATLAGSCLFFAVTNFAVWVCAGPNPLTHKPYEPTLEALLQCYTNAVPFFENSLLGDIIYATALFGGFALARHWLPALREPTAGPTPTAAPAKEVRECALHS